VLDARLGAEPVEAVRAAGLAVLVLEPVGESLVVISEQLAHAKRRLAPHGLEKGRRKVVANLIVRNVDDRIAQALKEQAARHGRSAEAEHRVILEQALARTRRRSLADVLASMPDVGRDEDFERVDEQGSAARRVFD